MGVTGMTGGTTNESTDGETTGTDGTLTAMGQESHYPLRAMWTETAIGMTGTERGIGIGTVGLQTVSLSILPSPLLVDRESGSNLP